ncbi:MAG: extracellular solute-binding protein [Acidihalobacter sp.]|uniref:ABC transporter substrate-binding protein n=1 Tax=Acidihalobacter sp. TaxID=1872108 RepID=UPI00307EF1FD
MDDEKRLERLLVRYQDGKISRRTFLGLLAAAGASVGLIGGPFNRAALAAGAKQIHYDGWGGIVSAAFEKYAFKPFEKKTGITVISGTFGNADQYLARVKASQPGEYNIAHLSGVFDYVRYYDLGLGSVLNESNIPNLQYVIKSLETPLRKISKGKLSAVPYDYGTTGLAYNRKYISDEEIRQKGAKILIDPKYKGKIGGWGEWKTRIWYAALQTSQNPNDIKDMNAVWDAIRKNRDLVLKYWSSGAELMSLLANEEIYVTEAWSGRIAALQQQGKDIGYYDPPGGLGWQECLFVMKGSPMQACEELLNYTLRPEVAIAIAEGQNYPPSLDPTKVKLSKKVESLPAFDPTGTLDKLNFFDPTYWNRHQSDWSAKFSRIEKGF